MTQLRANDSFKGKGVIASAFLSDYVLMDLGSNPHQVTFFIYLNRDLINKQMLTLQSE